MMRIKWYVFLPALLILILAAWQIAPAQEPEEESQPEQQTEEVMPMEEQPEAEPLLDMSSPSLFKAARLDSIYRAWMAPDSMGVRRYFFRRTFEVDDQPSAGHIWITADDNYNLYVNGVYVASDGTDSLDWMYIDDFDIGTYLKKGRNAVVVETEDIDSTKMGFRVALKYETIPDIDRQLDLMVERELENQERLRQERIMQQRGGQDVFPPPEEGGPTPEEVKVLRTVKKNKLY